MPHFRHMTMPLLGKELTEQAARKRTYAVRVVYALLLFLVSALLLHEVLRMAAYGSAWRLMGSGRQVLEPLVIFQFVGICLFLPAMMAGTIAGEKEQDSLALLFLTDMGPWEILLQKYLGRLVPMFSFLLLSLPVMAVAYALGGVESRMVAAAAVMLLLTCLQVGALALLCSAVCRTSVAAVVTSYLALAAFYLVPPLLEACDVFSHAVVTENVLYCLIPPAVMESAGRPSSAWGTLVRYIPVLLSIALLLLLARLFLVRRAFATARHPLQAFFRGLDRTFKRWNDRLGGIVMGPVDDAFPDQDPVAWRELHKRALGKARYLVRLGLLLEVPVLLVGLLLLAGHNTRSEFIILVCVIWALAALLLTVQGANTIVAERTHQTLEVLLTTPVYGEEIVRQKMRALHRLCLLFAIPLLTAAAMSSIGHDSFSTYYSWYGAQGPGVYLAASVLCAAIYLPLLAWFSMWIGLRVRTRNRAILAALVGLLVWCLAAPLALIILEVCGVFRMNAGNHTFPDCLMLLSPAAGVLATEIGWGNRYGPFSGIDLGVMVANFLLYGAILFRLRYICLRDADRLLRRE